MFKKFELFDPSIPRQWRKAAVITVAMWSVMLIPILIFAPKLTGTTSMDFIPPSGSDSQHGADALNKYFPSVQSTNQFAIVIEGPKIYPHNQPVKEYSKFIADGVVQYNADHPGEWPEEVIFCTLSTYAVNGSYQGCLDGEYLFPLMRSRVLVSKDNTLTILTIVFTDPTGTVGLSATSGDFLQDFAEHLRNHMVHNMGSYNSSYSAKATGILMLGIDGMQGTMHDMAQSDMIIIPIAFAIFTYYIRSVRLLLLPFVSLILSVGAAFAAVYPISKYSGMQFMTMVPQTMMSCCLAISLDYNLFILMRFREGVEMGFSIKATVGAIVRHTCGHTIAISGLLITLAWFGMMLIPAQPILTQGLGTGIATLIVVLVNVTMTPALLIIFPGFFKVKTDLSIVKNLWAKYVSRSNGKDMATNTVQEDDMETCEDMSEGETERLVHSASGIPVDKAALQKDDVWYKIAKFVQRHSIALIVVILLAGAPFYIRAPDIKTSLDPFQFVPRNSDSLTAWRDMAAKFPAGIFLPYFIVVEDTTNSELINTTIGYEMLGNLTDRIMHGTKMADYPDPDGYLEAIVQFPNISHVGLCKPPGVEMWDGVITWEYLYSEEHGLLVHDSDFNPWTKEICKLAYEEVFRKNVKNNTATFMTVVTPFQPTGPVSTDFMDELFDILGDFNDNPYGLRMYITGGNTVSRDFNKIVDNATILMLGSIVGFVCMVVLAAFRSVTIPLRMAVTISYTVATTFGVAYYVFQTDAFHWMFPYLKDFGHSIFWAVPTMAICITVALGMDYDVFLLTRIYEYRTQYEYESDAAIIKGLTKTGPIITGAGIIMTIAFAGLILSSCVALNQFGVLLCSSVLLDTFVVRSLFVPATMFLSKELVWFPRSVPKGAHTEDEFVDEQEDVGLD